MADVARATRLRYAERMYSTRGVPMARAGSIVWVVLITGCISSTTSAPKDGGTGTSPSGTSSGSSGSSGSSSPGSSSGGDASSPSDAQVPSDAGAQGWCNTPANSDCIDYNAGFIASDAQADCSTRKGAYSATGSCDRASSVGGCYQVFGTGKIITTWYYSPITAQAAMGECSVDGNATYVAP